MLGAIVAAEAAFWLFLLGGLAVRYIVKRQRASSILLACVPLVDLVLIALVTMDLAAGADPGRVHALAAMYLGFTVAFGPTTISWADAWFRYRFANGPRPLKPPKGSRRSVLALWREWLRVVLAAAVATLGMAVMIIAEGSPLPSSLEAVASHPIWASLHTLGLIVVIWFLAGPAFSGRGDPGLDRPGPHPGR